MLLIIGREDTDCIHVVDAARRKQVFVSVVVPQAKFNVDDSCIPEYGSHNFSSKPTRFEVLALEVLTFLVI
jgi:hypothetical protein